MRKPFRYEGYLAESAYNLAAFTDYGYRMPAWLADEMRVFRRMYELFRWMDSCRNGYTIGVNTLKRFQHVRDSLCENGEWISPQLAQMAQETILSIGELHRAVFNHYDTTRTIQILDRSERHAWDEIAKGIGTILNKAPDPVWRSRHEAESPSPVVLVKELWK